MDSLDAVRGVAAMMVAAYHTGEMLRAPGFYGRPVWLNFFSFGGAGIVVFFILSGFVISMITERLRGQMAALPHYLYRRAVRILPLYWFYLLVMVALVWLVEGTITASPRAFWLGSVLLWPVGGFPVLQVGWTLTFELFFYAVCGLLIVSRVFFAVWAGWIAFVLWTLVGAIEPRTSMNSLAAIAGNQVNLLFFLGLALFACYKRNPGRFRSAKPAVVGGAIFVAAGLGEAADLQLDPLLGQVLFALGACLVLLPLLSLERCGGAVMPPLFVKLGAASYSVYLCHLPLLYGVASFLDRGWATWLPAELSFVLLMLGIAVAGLAYYRCIEAPLLRLLYRIGPAAAPHGARIRVPRPDRMPLGGGL